MDNGRTGYNPNPNPPVRSTDGSGYSEGWQKKTVIPKEQPGLIDRLANTFFTASDDKRSETTYSRDPRVSTSTRPTEGVATTTKYINGIPYSETTAISPSTEDRIKLAQQQRYMPSVPAPYPNPYHPHMAVSVETKETVQYPSGRRKEEITKKTTYY